MPWVILQSEIVALPGHSHLFVFFFFVVFFFLFFFFFGGGGGLYVHFVWLSINN